MVRLPVAGEKFAEILLAEVTRMVEDDVKNDFHTACVRRVNQVLKEYIFGLCVGLVAAVHFREVACVVAVVVVARSVLHDGRNPDCGEAQCLDVVQTLNHALEVAAPLGVAFVARLDCVPTVDVVARVAVVETGGHKEIDGFVTEVRAAAEGGGSGCHRRQAHTYKEQKYT